MTDHELRPLSMNRRVTITELCTRTSAHTTFVRELVEEGIIEPVGQERGEWVFSEVVIVRVRKAVTLNRELGVNMPGIGLALQLLEELRRL